MINPSYSEFLENKIRLFCTLTGNPPDSMLGFITAFGPLTLKHAKSLDLLTDQMMCAAFGRVPEARHAVDQELHKRFGYSRLSAHPHTVAKRIARNGVIANDDEARIVLEILANIDDVAFRTKSRQTLGRFLRQYEQSRRSAQ